MKKATNVFLRPRRILEVVLGVFLQVRVHFILLEDRLVRGCHEILWLLGVPLDEVDRIFGGAGQALVKAALCEYNEMCSSKNGVHFLLVIYCQERRVDELEKLLMVCFPDFRKAHGLEEFLINVPVVGVIAGMTAGSLVKLRGRVPRPYSCVFFLGCSINKETCV